MSRNLRFLLLYLLSFATFYFCGSYFGAKTTLVNPKALFAKFHAELQGYEVADQALYFLFQEATYPNGAWMALMLLILIPAIFTALLLKIRDRLKGRRHFDIEV